MPAPPRVLLAVDVFAGYQRRIVRGVLDYEARHRRGWRFLFDPRPAADAGERLGRYGDADAVVLHGPHQTREAGRLVGRFRRRGVPVVFAGHAVEGLPCACPDEAAVGRMAFEHLRGKGFARFAYFATPPGQPVFDARFAGLTAAAGGLGPVVRSPDACAADGPRGRRALVGWVASLETPVGLLCGNIDFARRAAGACAEAGVDVPTRVGVLGVDPDDLFCDMVHPPLSTIDHGMRRVGYEAARLLDRLLRGETVPDRPVVVPPAGVEQRQSTDTLAVEDQDVAAVLRAIDAGLEEESVGARDLIEAAAVGRRSLEQRFKRAVGRGVQEELVRRRIERAKALLAEAGPFGPMKLPEVAARCGFANAARLSEAFVRVAGVRPGRWRQSVSG